MSCNVWAYAGPAPRSVEWGRRPYELTWSVSNNTTSMCLCLRTPESGRKPGGIRRNGAGHSRALPTQLQLGILYADSRQGQGGEQGQFIGAWPGRGAGRAVAWASF